MKAITEDEYRQQLKVNMRILHDAVDGVEYPQLSAFLLSYGKSLYNKLFAMLEYFIHYGEDERQRMSYYEGRGWEMMLSYDIMVTLGAGKDKKTWIKTIDKLCALQMLGRFRPRKDEYRLYNSAVQQLSADRAIKAGREPVMWYRVPEYTDRLLKIAEAKTPAVKAMGNGIDKDAIRDAFGAKMANRITDTGYPMHDETETRRVIIETELNLQIEKYGYSTHERVLSAIGGKVESSAFGDKWRWEETFRSYKPLLYAIRQLKEGRPTKADKERWALNDDSWIIKADS